MGSWERRRGGPALADYAVGHRVKVGLWLGSSYQNKARHFKKSIKGIPLHKRASLVAQRQESACHCKRLGFDLCVRKIPWRRKWLPTPVFWPRESHGQRCLPGYSLWGCKELDTTGQPSIALHNKLFNTLLNICMYLSFVYLVNG